MRHLLGLPVLSGSLVIAVLLSVLTVRAQGFDSHAGYYYPEPQTRETYVSDTKPAAEATESSRAAFVVGLAAQQFEQNHIPGYHLFAKGEHLEKLIIVATGDGQYDTLYRLRALLASLTSMARGTPLFSQTAEPYKFNFLDFCKLLGFTQVTVSNGRDMAHQIFIR
ncbi:hypothetical protein [Roseibium aggregatum]|uniref:Molybdopterin-guanine dinucleotide biosynthesis protein A n=1 Tax=Roseibium aggregatum TaxID=187304 RepID=A0A926S5X3_9HYPH|nr:hypothetical protein [Roseibium aggregatum]MBD1546936.1 hypothetical protein [Roseibium aggregatum]